MHALIHKASVFLIVELDQVWVLRSRQIEVRE